MVNVFKKMVAALQALSAADFRQGAVTVTERLKEDDGERAVRERARQVKWYSHCRGTDLGPVRRRSRRIATLQAQGLWAHLQRLYGSPVYLLEETGEATGPRPMPD